MKGFKSSLIAVVLCAMVAGLTVFSTGAKAGAAYGMSLAGGVVIPSLLPILILTSTLQKSRGRAVFEKIFCIPFKALHLSEGTVAPVIFGLIGGYPAGAALTCSQYKSGEISKGEARRIMQFNMCGGVAFVISAVGTGYYKSARAGIVLYLSSVMSSVIIAAVSGLFAKKEVAKSYTKSYLPIDDALCEAAESSTKGVLIMSAYIVLFCAVKEIVKIPAFTLPLVEITSGVFSIKALSLELCAAYLAFGGLCLHFQVLGYLKEMGVKYPEFFAFRVVGAGLAALICRVLLHFFPVTASVFLSASGEIPFAFTQVNTAFGVIVMLGCAVLVLDAQGKKIKL